MSWKKGQGILDLKMHLHSKNMKVFNLDFMHHMYIFIYICIGFESYIFIYVEREYKEYIFIYIYWI